METSQFEETGQAESAKVAGDRQEVRKIKLIIALCLLVIAAVWTVVKFIPLIRN